MKTDRDLKPQLRLGYTTLELVVALVISAIVTALVAYAFFGLRDPLRSATQEASNAIKYTRSLAIGTTSACRITATSISQLDIECSTTCTGAAWAPAEAGATVELNEVAITSVNGMAFMVGDTETVTCFDSRGAAANAASMVLTYDDNGQTTANQIDVLLGGAVSETSL